MKKKLSTTAVFFSLIIVDHAKVHIFFSGKVEMVKFCNVAIGKSVPENLPKYRFCQINWQYPNGCLWYNCQFYQSKIEK
jgi:hypothetical protein